MPGPGNYALYVVQVERQVKEWSLAGGYAGEAVVNRAANPLLFDPEQGFAKSFVGRAAWTIDPSRTLTIEAVVRSASPSREPSIRRASDNTGARRRGVAWIRGSMTDFLGEYRRNSYGSLAIRYSF